MVTLVAEMATPLTERASAVTNSRRKPSMQSAEYVVVLNSTDAQPLDSGRRAQTVVVKARGAVDARETAELHFGGKAIVANRK
jgi:hypothetical protein